LRLRSVEFVINVGFDIKTPLRISYYKHDVY